MANTGIVAAKRPLPPLMGLTDAAAARIQEIQKDSAGRILRVSVSGKGCAGLKYDLSWVDAAGPGDEAVSDRGAGFLVDRKATMFLAGSVMDYVTSQMSSTFTFSNPNEVNRCGCGESFGV